MREDTPRENERSEATHRDSGRLGGLFAKQRALPEQMPHLEDWRRLLAAERGAGEAIRLAGHLQVRYNELYASRPHFNDPAPNAHLVGTILPLLALFQVLSETEADCSREEVVAQVEGMYKALYARPERRIALLRYVPRAFDIFRWVARRDLRSYSSEGWTYKVVEDSPRRFAVNMTRCLYVDVFADYGTPELTAIICKSDDWVFRALPPSIRWQRTKMIGQGDDCCDFSWSRILA